MPKKDIVYIVGNFNTKLGSQAEMDITGSSESEERDDASKHLVHFAMKIDFKSYLTSPKSFPCIEVETRFELLDAAEKVQEKKFNLPSLTYHARSLKKKHKWLSGKIISIAKQRKAAKTACKWKKARRLNADFQRAARRDNIYRNQRCKQLKENCVKGHTRNAFAQVKRI